VSGDGAGQVRDLRDDAVVDEHGDTVVRGRRYRGVTFETLVPPTPAGTRFVLDDVVLEGCRTQGGFFLTEQCVLTAVTVLDLDCGDTLHVSARTRLEGVTIAGRSPGTLWIRPDDEPADEPLAPTLDISRYTGTVSITGVRTDGIVLDAERHVVVPGALFDGVDWTGLGLGPASFWRLAARKVKGTGAPDGVVSVPSGDERALRDLTVLREQGLLTPR